MMVWSRPPLACVREQIGSKHPNAPLMVRFANFLFVSVPQPWQFRSQ